VPVPTRGGQWGDRVAMREKHPGVYRSIAWREYGQHARHIGLGLVASASSARRSSPTTVRSGSPSVRQGVSGRRANLRSAVCPFAIA